jgi:hypothetical protein
MFWPHSDFQIYGIPDLSAPMRRKGGRWSAASPIAETAGFDASALCALAFAGARFAIALDPTRPAADYLRQTFTTADGLPLNVVNDLLQTRDGFLIVGTANGVSRFDGRRFTGMNSDPPQALIVHGMAEAPDGDIWVATRFGVYRFPHAEIPQRRQHLAAYHLGQGSHDSVRCLHFSRGGERCGPGRLTVCSTFPKTTSS